MQPKIGDQLRVLDVRGDDVVCQLPDGTIVTLKKMGHQPPPAEPPWFVNMSAPRPRI